MANESQDQNRSGRPLRKQGEEAIGRFAQEFLQNPVVTGALTTVFETRERATRAQEVAMSALNLPSAADLERLTRRVRSVAQRIEGLEDGIDRLSDKLEDAAASSTLPDRIAALEEKLDTRLGALEDRLATVTALLEQAAAAPAAPAEPAPAQDAESEIVDAEIVEAAAEPETGEAEPES